MFGTYEQDNDTSNGEEEIEWQVLDEKDGKKLLISKYALDCKPYNVTQTNVTWETCTLRTWLNEDFLNTAFTDAEKAIIPTVTISTDDNPNHFTNSGSETQDKLFLLSIPEAQEYFSSSDMRRCKPTPYVEAKRTDSGEFIFWWLRTSGYRQSYETIVGAIGNLQGLGIGVDNTTGVRPALWVDPES